MGTFKDSTICYLDAPYNPNYFYEVDIGTHKDKIALVGGLVGGLGNIRPYSYALIKDCILNFDRMYKNDNQSASERKEKSGKFIIQKAFAYIKLYEQSTPPYEFVANPYSFDYWFNNFGALEQKLYIGFTSQLTK